MSFVIYTFFKFVKSLKGVDGMDLKDAVEIIVKHNKKIARLIQYVCGWDEEKTLRDIS